MGQQQLLLLVLGIVFIGGAVVAGAHAFKGEKQVENRVFVFQEALVIVHHLQIWKLKPTSVGGGANLHGFDKINFSSIGYPRMLLSNRVYKTEHGCYQLQTRGEDHDAVLTLSAPTCSDKDYVAHVIVQGVTPDDIDWQHVPPTSLSLLEQAVDGR